MKIYISPNPEKEHCLEYTKKACDILVANGCELYADEELKSIIKDDRIVFGAPEDIVGSCDLILVSGGDGTILKHSKKLSGYGKAILGLNCGRLGFMATLEHDELYLLDDFCKGHYSVSDRMMIEAKVILKSGEVKSFAALNDIVFMKSEDCKIADFKVTKGEAVVSELRADGLIFSTPTGATAYSLSAGGPLIEPELECIEFTQICPHSLFARSMIFSPDSVLTVSFSSKVSGNVILTADGVGELSLSPSDRVEIRRCASRVSLIDITGNSFYNSISKKLMTPMKGE